MTLAQIKADERVCSVENVYGDGWQDEDTKYELSLEDGYMFDDGSHVNRYRTVKEMSDELQYGVVEEKE
ncbi:MAG: hypothetical protein MJZ37_06275 [Bacilli bacterium]|nr:hypothetical protein [Bacilli bacterium]